MSYREELRKFRRALLYQALVENGFVVSAAARALEVDRNHADRMLRAAGLDVAQAKANFLSASLLTEWRMTEPKRERLETTRPSITKKLHVGENKGYITVGLYPDGRPGEVFITLDKAGSAARGWADAWATLFSIGLQHGVPLRVMLDKAQAVRFEPMGPTGDPEFPMVSSVLDYAARWMRKKFLDGKKDLPSDGKGV